MSSQDSPSALRDKPAPKLNCPRCSKSIVWSAEFPFRPFCSKRCQLIDLGQWADESHKIAGESLFDPMPSEDDSAD